MILDQILTHHTAAELAADWSAAREAHGDTATEAHLPRTAAERRADALVAIFLDAASTPPGGRDPKIVLNLLMTWDECQHELTRLAARDPDNAPPSRPGWPTAGPFAGPVPRCGTLDGTWLDPADAVELSVGAHLRRVVIGANSAVINLGRPARFFTGSARDAIMLASPHCVWAACDTPTSRCQADHVTEHHRGGPTDPTNGAPLCGHHNRPEHHKFRVWRDPTGRWHTYRPDGTEI